MAGQLAAKDSLVAALGGAIGVVLTGSVVVAVLMPYRSVAGGGALTDVGGVEAAG